MGQSHSAEPPREVPIEQLSHELALRFASKCYTHLEIAHFKDNFKTLADHQEDVEYWKEDTLCRFFSLPEPLRAGPVLYQMCTYLGAFPFPSLAPAILTREAMLKVITITTGRYKKILKRGNHDKVKLLFRSLAVFDRRASMPAKEKPDMEQLIKEQLPDDMLQESEIEKGVHSHAGGFAIDEPANDEEEEDDDDLALAALDSLDAIEVFRHDQRTEKKLSQAIIPAENLKQLVSLLLLIADVEPLTPLETYYGSRFGTASLQPFITSADAIVAAFDPDPQSQGIRYSNFVKTITTVFPDLFEPLNGLFEHFLFSKNINLNKQQSDISRPALGAIVAARTSPIYRTPDDTSTYILSDILLSQLSMSIRLTTDPNTSTSKLQPIFSSNARFNNLYSTSNHGTSLSSFSRNVLSWQSSTLLLISGTLPSTNTPITLGAYLPHPWSSTPQPLTADGPWLSSSLFLLHPRHAIFPANTHNRTIQPSHFNAKTGISLGCIIPTQTSRTGPPSPPVLGPVSILIDADMQDLTFQHDGNLGSGAFVTDPGLEIAQSHTHPAHSSISSPIPKKITCPLDTLEVWGISFPSPDSRDDEVTKQAKRLEWEEQEAARRRGVNFGGDKDGARALLEMAGIVGDHGRSGGSV